MIDIARGTVTRGTVETQLVCGTAEHSCLFCHRMIPPGFLHFSLYARDALDPWNFALAWGYRMHVACHCDHQTGAPRAPPGDWDEAAGVEVAIVHNRDARPYLRLHGLSPWTGHPCGPEQAVQEGYLAVLLGLPGAEDVTNVLELDTANAPRRMEGP